jgi:mono/diheme cytochrome c family protein
LRRPSSLRLTGVQDMLKGLVRWGLIGLGILFVGIQAIPYGRNHTNPSTRLEPAWDSPETRELAVRACFDCHSNETDWPWYSYIAPFSWLVQGDVDDGRKKLNFSEWNPPQEHAGQAAKMVREGTMPLWRYVALHPRANLSPAETQALTQGLVATIGEEKGEDHEHNDEREQHR